MSEDRKFVELQDLSQYADGPGPYQLALSTLGMALDATLGRPIVEPIGQLSVDRLSRQMTDLDKRFGQNAEAVHSRIARLEAAGESPNERLLSEDRFAALAADQENGFVAIGNSLQEIRGRLEALERHPVVGLSQPTRDEFARMAVQVTALTGQIAQLRQSMEQKHHSDQSWRRMVDNILGRRTPRG